MQTTLRINDETYRQAKAEAAKRGETLTRYIENALEARNRQSQKPKSDMQKEIEERNELMEALLRKTAHFKIGEAPTREENNER